jgi:hypothetical protein
MAIDSYDNLKATIIRLDGSDSISDIVDDAIDLAEAEMYSNPEAPIRHRSMEARSTASTGGTRFLALPDGFLEMRGLRLVLSGGNTDVRYATPESLEVVAGSGRPRVFTVTSQLEFDRIPDSTYTIEMSFYAKITALDDTNTTNDILTDQPSAYLYGALWAVNLFNAEEEKAQYYYGLFINALKGLNKRFSKGRFGPAPRMRTEGSTP